MTPRFISVLICALFSHLALSDDAPSDEESALGFEDQYVSIATGYEEALSRAPAVASIITQKQIEAMGARTLEDILVSVPGVHVGISSSRFDPIYTIRGIHTGATPQVLVLINSVPITQLFKGDRGYFPAIPASTIKQVEIIRGPGSAVYGADAFAGVINVITKSGRDVNGVSVSGGAGSFDSREGSVLYGATQGDIDYLFAFNYYHTDGDQDRTVDSDAQTLFDSLPFASSPASLASGPQGPGVLQTQAERFDIRGEVGDENWRFRALNWIRRNMGNGPSDSQAIDTHGDTDINDYLFDLTYKTPLFNNNTEFQTTVSHMRVDYRSYMVLFPPNTVLPIAVDGNIGRPGTPVLFTDGYIGAPSFTEEHNRIDMQLFLSKLGDHRVRIGAGALSARLSASEQKNFGPGVLDSVTVGGNLPTSVSGPPVSVYGDDLYLSPNSRDLYYLSAQDQWYLAPDWDLTAGVRHDKYSDFGETTNPRAALIWHPSYDLTVKLLYGEAFRAPHFASLYNQNNPILLSDPSLSPERIKTHELALDYQLSFDTRTRISLFHYRIKDMIEPVDVPNVGTIASNVGARKAGGFEWEVSWKMRADLEFTGSYSFQDARDIKNGGPVGDSPRQKIYLLAQWQASDLWQINPKISWIGDRQRVADDPRSRIDNYVMTDLLILRKNAVKDWDAQLMVRNVFDVDAKEPSPYSNRYPDGTAIVDDYPLESRSWFVTLRYLYQ